MNAFPLEPIEKASIVVGARRAGAQAHSLLAGPH